eukprot:TRINITY_DN5376_c0_g1_i1.p1 TRINITY_DN5376_c0_g1~~TRINITY_DN5376_c0_g1_i1.p1  ORF type:complete len:385 (-),score=40.36 TRINITY_DN5376_c0_g1_i1:222-1289(-)
MVNLEGEGLNMVDLHSGEVLWSINCEPGAMNASGDGNSLLVSGANVGKVLNASSGELIQSISAGEDKKIHHGILNCDGSIAALAIGERYVSDNISVQICNVSTGATIAELGEAALISQTPWSKFPIWEFSSDGAFLAAVVEGNVIKVWRTDNGECTTMLQGHTKDIIKLKFSSDASELFSGSRDESCRVWNRTTGECVKNLTSSAKHAFFDFSDDGAFLLRSALSDEPKDCYDCGGAEIIDVATGDRVCFFQATDFSFIFGDFSKDGASVIFSGEITTAIGNPKTGDIVATIKTGDPNSGEICSLAPNLDKSVLIGIRPPNGPTERGFARLYRADDGTLTHTISSKHITICIAAF